MFTCTESTPSTTSLPRVGVRIYDSQSPNPPDDKAIGDDTESIGYRMTGEIYLNCKCIGTASPWTWRDTLGIEICMSTMDSSLPPQLSFFLNGKPQYTISCPSVSLRLGVCSVPSSAFYYPTLHLSLSFPGISP